MSDLTADFCIRVRHVIILKKVKDELKSLKRPDIEAALSSIIDDNMEALRDMATFMEKAQPENLQLD